MQCSSNHADDSVILIGMPGSGKSTLGVLLAKQLGKKFVDTDIDLQTHLDTTLQDFLNQHGYMALREAEAHVLESGQYRNYVVATGGSAVYSDSGMRNLKKYGLCVYLRAELSTIEERIQNFDSRGVAAPAGIGLVDIYAERTPLYEQYADITVDVDVSRAEDVAEFIAGQLSARQ